MNAHTRGLTGTQPVPFYRPVGNECTLFETAHANGLPLLLKGPTGCGKTRFVEHMAARLGRPLYTVACHDDLSAADLIGRYLLRGGETEWIDGPLTRAVREGAICYLDEIVEARKDVTVVLHPLTDSRRTLMIDRTGEELTAPPGFSRNLAVSAYFSHTSRVMNGGSITTMSNVPFSASASAKSTGALKSYRTNPRSLFHCSSRSKHHDRARTSLFSEKYTLGVLRKHALVSSDAHTVSTSRTMASMLRLLYQY